MMPDPENLLKRIDLEIPLIAFYDAPDPSAFEPVIEPPPESRICIFSYYKKWLKGTTLHLTKGNHGCGGAGRFYFGVQVMPKKAFIKFLAEDEGLKSSLELMEAWVDSNDGYKPTHEHIFIGLLKENLYEYAQSITFFVNPDQLSTLMLGAQYHSGVGEPPTVIAPFGAGCGLLWPFDFDDWPQAAIGATDIAMRNHVPPHILAFTVNRPMFKQLCELDESSFLYKPFLQKLRKSRGLPAQS